MSAEKICKEDKRWCCARVAVCSQVKLFRLSPHVFVLGLQQLSQQVSSPMKVHKLN